MSHTAKHNLIPVTELREYFSYDSVSGILTWIKRTGVAVPGLRAGSLDADGYRYVNFKRRSLAEHRICWALYFGAWPAGLLDHKNTHKDENWIENLREATVTDNNRNRPKQSNNTSGFKGVSLCKASGKFHAKITANKETFSLGYFATAVEASVVYINAAKELHGQFARH